MVKKGENVIAAFFAFMNIKQVAEILDCSERTVQSYRASGKLSVRYEKVLGARGMPKAVFDEQEVRSLKQELSEPTYLSLPEVASDLLQQNNSENLLTEDRLNCIQQAFSAWGYSYYLSGIRQKIFLRIKEAADFSGLSQSGIKKAIKNKELRAIKEGGAWKIKNVDLIIFLESLTVE